MLPAPWYGHRYPRLEDLELLADSYGVPVRYGRYPKPTCLWDLDGPLVIFVPGYNGQLARMWGLAHELGHLHLHHGPIPHMVDKHEAEADAWAARALIPEARVRAYRNASVGAFLAAIHRHYQELPPVDCGVRRLAAVVATARLKALRESA